MGEKIGAEPVVRIGFEILMCIVEPTVETFRLGLLDWLDFNSGFWSVDTEVFLFLGLGGVVAVRDATVKGRKWDRPIEEESSGAEAEAPGVGDTSEEEAVGQVSFEETREEIDERVSMSVDAEEVASDALEEEEDLRGILGVLSTLGFVEWSKRWERSFFSSLSRSNPLMLPIPLRLLLLLLLLLSELSLVFFFLRWISRRRECELVGPFLVVGVGQ